MRSTAPARRYFIVAFETVRMLVCVTIALSCSSFQDRPLTAVFLNASLIRAIECDMALTVCPKVLLFLVFLLSISFFCCLWTREKSRLQSLLPHPLKPVPILTSFEPRPYFSVQFRAVQSGIYALGKPIGASLRL